MTEGMGNTGPLADLDVSAMELDPYPPNDLSSPRTQHSMKKQSDVPPASVLGQFSFAPATQTTVVTTTTTTTTKFPPILMPPPRRIRHLDSKQYPLANTPTPLALRNLTFQVDGKKTNFTEADDATLALAQVCTSLSCRAKYRVARLICVSSFTKRQDDSNRQMDL